MKSKSHKQKAVIMPETPFEAPPFPFHPVDDATMIFGSSIPGYGEVIAAVPEEFNENRNPFCEFAEHIFFSGVDWSELAWRSNDPRVRTAQIRYFRAWIGSFEPQHEVKERVCGWLLSLMLTEAPRR